MALKLALLSFEFTSVDGLVFDPSFEHDFTRVDPAPGESVQPVLKLAFQRIKSCISASITSSFEFGINSLNNINNFLHIATSTIDAEVYHTDGSSGTTCINVIIKFYRLQPSTVFKAAIDIEEMPSSSISANETVFKHGMTNKNIDKLVKELDSKFQLKGILEYIPLIKRGRLDIPHFLVSSDQRVLEYDFKRLLFHKQSQYQDIKIVSSPSLGNTLLLDDLQNLAEIDLPYTYALMDRGNVSYKDKEILILGGGDGGLLYELLKESPKFVTMAEIDPIVIEACRDHLRPCGEVLKYLDGANYKIILEDCIKVLRNSIADGKKYDVIFNDLTDIPVSKSEESINAFEPSAVQKESPWHFIETIFNLSLACLAGDGLYMNHATGKSSKESLKAYEEFLRNSKIKVNFQSRSSYVPSFMEIWVFYTITRQQS